MESVDDFFSQDSLQTKMKETIRNLVKKDITYIDYDFSEGSEEITSVSIRLNFPQDEKNSSYIRKYLTFSIMQYPGCCGFAAVSALYVPMELRNLGLGKMLLSHALDACKFAKYCGVFATIADPKESSQEAANENANVHCYKSIRKVLESSGFLRLENASSQRSHKTHNYIDTYFKSI